MGCMEINAGSLLAPDIRHIGCGGGLGGTTSQTFTYNGTPSLGTDGTPQSFVVPSGVTSLTVEAWGAQGGKGSFSTDTDGLGGYIKATIAVTSGETLTVLVGGQPLGTKTGGYNGGGNGNLSGATFGGGGGGGSDVRQGGSAVANRVIAAGGGGGSGASSSGSTAGLRGGHGGASTGEDGYVFGVHNITTGKGGTSSAGGAGGVGGVATGSAGSAGQGGAGGTNRWPGGGGGGWYGGGGAGSEVSATQAGAGGGSNGTTGTVVTTTQGVRSGHGEVVLSWTEPATTGRLRGFFDGRMWQEACDDDTDTTVNVLTSNQSTLEAGTTSGYAAVAAPDYAPTIYTSLSAATDQKHSGTYALKVSTLAFSVQTSWQTPTGTSGFAVTPGKGYTPTGWVRANDSGVTLRASIRWYDSGGSLLSTTHGNYLAVPNGSWTQDTWNDSGGVGGPMIAPSGAAFGSVLWLSSTRSFDLWIDDVTVDELTTLERHPIEIELSTGATVAVCMVPV